MKRTIILFLTLTTLSICTSAQTAQEILSRMEAVLEPQEKAGVIMTVETHIPILGKSIALTYSLGDKSRMESEIMGVSFISWSDKNTSWTYVAETNEVEIKNEDIDPEDEGNDIEIFMDITEGYDVSIKKETADEWHIQGVKNKSNQDPEAPKKLMIVVAKGTYLPISLSAKAYGISAVMKDIKFGVSEKDVTFDPNDYPGVKIVDKR